MPRLENMTIGELEDAVRRHLCVCGCPDTRHEVGGRYRCSSADYSCGCTGLHVVTFNRMILERIRRLEQALGKEDADEYILGEDVTHLARPKARDNQETSASSPVQQIDVDGG